MREFNGRVAAITGAGSGIGRALALALAGRGCHLALCDIDEPRLEETSQRCRAYGVTVSAHAVDVAEESAVMAWATDAVAEHGAVHLLVNNAGVALIATVEEAKVEDLRWLMGINYWGVVHGTKAFLPHLKASGDGHIVNLSSVFGLVSVPTQSAYNSAKFAVRGFSDALRMELEIAGAPVSVTTVHPGGVKTNIARSARAYDGGHAMSGGVMEDKTFERLAITTPHRAARRILTAVEKDRRRVLVGPDAAVIDVISRLPVGLYQRAIVRGARRRRG
ncbi:MAG: SDR family NAD(P)-dependent oxidoreductase [Acidimicrobiales bacterium]